MTKLQKQKLLDFSHALVDQKKAEVIIPAQEASTGFCWDVGVARGTGLLKVPTLGEFASEEATLLFYDGGEAMRSYEQHANAVVRPRGYSCEESGGLAFFENSSVFFFIIVLKALLKYSLSFLK